MKAKVLFALVTIVGILGLTSAAAAPPGPYDDSSFLAAPKQIPPMPKGVVWNGSESLGLEMAAWLDPSLPQIWCAIRNPGKEEVRYCGYFLDYGEHVQVYARPKGTTEWRQIGPRGPVPRFGLGPRPDSYRTVGGGAVISSSHRWQLRGVPGPKFTLHVYLDHYAWPQGWSGEGEVLIELGGLDFGIKEPRTALKSGPVTVNLGDLRTTRLQRAIDEYSEAIRHNPQDAVAYCRLGRLRKYDVWDDSKRLAALEDAIADFTKAIRINPKYAEAYCCRGNEYISRSATAKQPSDLDLAIADFDKAIQLEPEYAAAFEMRATAYCGQGNLDKAIADISEAVRLAPTSIAYYRRSVWYEKKGDKSKAAEDKAEAEKLERASKEDQ